MVADLPHPWLDAIGIPDRVGDAIMAFLVLVIVTSVSMVFGELVPKYLAVGAPAVDRPRRRAAFNCCSRCCSPRPSD